MNKHIELVKKWLADPESVSLEELKANKETADAAYADWAAYGAAEAAANAAYDAAYAAYWDAANAAYAAYWAYGAADDAKAAYWRSEAIKHVKKHEELNK